MMLVGLHAIWGVTGWSRNACAKLLGVVAFVGSRRDPLAPGNLFDHCDCGLRLGATMGFGHLAMDRDAVAVLHQHVPGVAKYSFSQMR